MIFSGSKVALSRRVANIVGSPVGVLVFDACSSLGV